MTGTRAECQDTIRDSLSDPSELIPACKSALGYCLCVNGYLGLLHYFWLVGWLPYRPIRDDDFFAPLRRCSFMTLLALVPAVFLSFFWFLRRVCCLLELQYLYHFALEVISLAICFSPTIVLANGCFDWAIPVVHTGRVVNKLNGTVIYASEDLSSRRGQRRGVGKAESGREKKMRFVVCKQVYDMTTVGQEVQWDVGSGLWGIAWHDGSFRTRRTEVDDCTLK